MIRDKYVSEIVQAALSEMRRNGITGHRARLKVALEFFAAAERYANNGHRAQAMLADAVAAHVSTLDGDKDD